jgi:chitodextrinase
LVGGRAAHAAVGGPTTSSASTGPVAAYNFDVGAGTTLADLSGNSSTGTIAGANWSTGHTGRALSFDGNGDWVTIPDNSNLDLSTAMTLEAWVYPTQFGSSWRTVVTKEQSSGLVYGLFASSDTTTPAALASLPGQDVVRGSSRLPRSTWTYLSATYDGQMLRLYVNGVQTATATGGGAMPASSQPLRIGGNGMSQWFRGRIDDLRIYNRALSSAEIQSDMQAPVTAPPADTQAPTTPTGLAASSPTNSSVTLTWSPSTDNTGVVGYGLYRNGASIGSSTGTSYQFTGLACGTSYSFSVDAFDAAGNRSGTGSISASTAACPPPPDSTPPTTPTGLVASAATTSSITLGWNAATDDVGVAGYGLYRNGTSTGSSTTRSYTFTGLSCGTSYQLAVDAYDAMGNRSPRASISAATTPCADTAAPSVPTGLATSNATASSIKLTWTASSDNTGVAGYGAYVNGAAAGSSATPTYTFSALSCGTNYTLAVDAYDAAGNRSAKATITAATSACVQTDTAPPSVPQDERFTGVTQTTIGLAWSAATDNVSVAGYSLYLNNVKVATTTQTSYTYSGLACGVTYTVGLEAFDAAGNASDRAYATGTTATSPCTPTADTQAPTTPAALAATGATTSSISIGWGASLDNVGVAGYGAYRNGTSVGSATSTAYTFTGLSCGTSYTLAVDAYDAAGNRSGKASISAATSACPVADTQPPSTPQGQQIGTATQTSIPMTWNASTDNVGVAGYRVYLNGALTTTTQQLVYTYTGLTCGTTYTVALAAYDAAGNASDPALAQGPATTAACSTPPPPPPPPPTSPTSLANLWVDVNGGSCVRLASPGGYVDAQACGSLSAAYGAASAGDTIMVGAGTYGRQVVPSGSKALTIRNAPGTTPVLGSTTVNASNVTMIGFKIQRNDDPGSTTATLEMLGDNLVFDGVDVDTKNMPERQGIQAAGNNNTFKNGSTYNVTDEKGAWISGANNTFDNVDFYNVYVTRDTVHNECAYVINADGFTIRNSKFWNCPTMDLYITRGSWYGAPPWGNVLVENNVFGHSRMPGGTEWHYYGFLLSGALSYDGAPINNFKIRYNTFEQAVGDDPALRATGASEWVGNLGGGWDCLPGFSYRYNVGEKCSSTDKAVSPAYSCGPPSCSSVTNAPLGWLNPANNDFHLTAGSPAIDAGDPTSYPPTDKDGHPRPVGTRPDAGAYEYG